MALTLATPSGGKIAGLSAFEFENAARQPVQARMSRSILVAIACGAITAACAVEPTPTFRSIEPVCVPADEVPDDAWVCSESLVVDCEEGPPDNVYVVADDESCGAWDLEAIEGPFEPGEQNVVVVDGNSGDEICVTTLEVRDESPPEITTAELELWPPNHKFHDIALADCIEEVDDCDADVELRLMWASSDEPENDRGDGNTAEDIVDLTADGVALRSERDGRADGRVYTLGFEAEDSSGNITEGTCRVVVPHDRSGKAVVDSGEAYRIERSE